MKKSFFAFALLIPVAASAADLPVKARPQMSAPAWSWTGFYGGINAGYAVASDTFTQGYVGNINNPVNLATSSTVDSTIVPKGGFAGLQAGYNYQIGSLVWGVEGDWQWADQKARACGLACSFTQTPDNVGDFRFGASGASVLSVDQKINWFATARGRLGWTPLEGTMLYATAGGAWMGIDETDQIRYVQALAGNVFTTTASFNNTKSGYVVGGGAEFRLWGNWTGKVEYLHIDVSGTNNSAAHFAAPVIGPLVLTTTTSSIRNDLVRVGVNYKVNPWEATAVSPSMTAMPVKGPVDSAWNWTGFYVGTNAGYGQASDDFLQNIVRSNPTFSYTYYNHSNAPKGEFLGLQGGYNYQTGAVVVGVEGDWQWADQNARSCGIVCSSTTSTSGTTASNISIDQRINWFATARARIGWTLSNGTMLYATGGGAWMGINETDTFLSASSFGPATFVQTTLNNTKGGYAFGGGAEFRLWGNWTGKVEYLHLDVAGISVTNGPDVVRVTTNTGRIKDDIARAGLNYHFAGPVVAKY